MKKALVAVLFLVLFVSSAGEVRASSQSTSLTASSNEHWLTNTQVSISGPTLSFGVWLNPSSLLANGDAAAIYQKRDVSGNGADIRVFLVNSSGTYQIVLTVNNWIFDTGRGGSLVTSPTGVWTYLWCTFDGSLGTNSKILCYQDGVALSMSNNNDLTNFFLDENFPSMIGASYPGPVYYFDGKLSHMRLYSSVIDPSTMYSTERCADHSTDPSLVAEWKFDGDGNDSSGHGYNLTPQNGAGFVSDVPPCLFTDTTPPSISAVSISSNNASTTLAKIGDTVTLSFTASEPVRTPAVTIAGRAANVATTTGNSFIASTTMQASDTEGLVPFTISLTDSAGNPSPVTTTTSDNSLVVFDKTPPALSIASGPAAGSTIATTSATFTFTTDADATTTCAFDAQSPVSCSNSFGTTTFAETSHVFNLLSADPAGNVASTSVSFTVALPPPAPTPDTPPAPAPNTNVGGGSISGPLSAGYQNTSPQSTSATTGTSLATTVISANDQTPTQTNPVDAVQNQPSQAPPVAHGISPGTTAGQANASQSPVTTSAATSIGNTIAGTEQPASAAGSGFPLPPWVEMGGIALLFGLGGFWLGTSSLFRPRG